MTGSSVFDYIHQADHAELADQLGLSLSSGAQSGGLASPSSGGSDEGGGSQGTNNPDGEFSPTYRNVQKLYKYLLNIWRGVSFHSEK